MEVLRVRARSAARESLQVRYGALQALYYLGTCALGGFAAIFLGYKGLSNSRIGIATGASCILSVILMPLVSSILERRPGLTIHRAVRWLMLGATACYALVAGLRLPAGAVMAIFALANALSLAAAPFLSQLAMSFNRVGCPVNFGLARGMGSLSYAVGAVALSAIVDIVTPTVLAWVFGLSVLLCLAVLAGMPAVEAPRGEGAGRSARADERNADAGGALRDIIHQRALVLVLVAFMLAFVASNCLNVYLIDIVRNVGGNTSMYGVAVFCMAASELPAMAIVPALRRRFSTGTLFVAVGAAYLLRNLMVITATSVPMVFAGLMFQSVSYGLLTPLLTYYISEVCSPRSEMLGQTLLSVATTGIGSMLGTVCGGFLQDALGLPAMLLFVAASTVAAAAVFACAGMRARRDEHGR